jgi:hypothetical protein
MNDFEEGSRKEICCGMFYMRRNMSYDRIVLDGATDSPSFGFNDTIL